MPDHSFFVGIGDSACFQVAHRRKRFLDLRAHLVEEAVRKFHPADVDRETEIVVTEKILLKPLPKRRRSHALRIMEGRGQCHPPNLNEPAKGRAIFVRAMPKCEWRMT